MLQLRKFKQKCIFYILEYNRAAKQNLETLHIVLSIYCQDFPLNENETIGFFSEL